MAENEVVTIIKGENQLVMR